LGPPGPTSVALTSLKEKNKREGVYTEAEIPNRVYGEGCDTAGKKNKRVHVLKKDASFGDGSRCISHERKAVGSKGCKGRDQWNDSSEPASPVQTMEECLRYDRSNRTHSRHAEKGRETKSWTDEIGQKKNATTSLPRTSESAVTPERNYDWLR